MIIVLETNVLFITLAWVSPSDSEDLFNDSNLTILIAVSHGCHNGVSWLVYPLHSLIRRHKYEFRGES